MNIEIRVKAKFSSRVARARLGTAAPRDRHAAAAWATSFLDECGLLGRRARAR